MKTNLGLVEFVHKAYAENWGYCLGTFGDIMTEQLLRAKMNQGGPTGRVARYNTKNQAYIRKFMGKRVSDCYGLVKAYLWWVGEGANPSYNYKGRTDRNQEMAFNAAREKGPLSNMPEIPGLVLWMKGHAGVYVGNGEFIEIAGAPKGMVKGKIVNGRVVKGSPFTHWFKDTYIKYEVVGPIKQPTAARTIKINFLGQVIAIQGLFKNDTNYIVIDGREVKLRSIFETMGFKVGWEQSTQTILVTR